jgi:hypothetical protein
MVLMLLASTAGASDADLESPACRDALAALQARETAMAATAAASGARPDRRPAAHTDAQWRALRATAAHACLGGAPGAPPPPVRGATAWPPIGVPPVASAPPAAVAPTGSLPPLPARIPPPTITRCDPTGCWMSTGEHLPQLGRNPNDPRVTCSVHGRVVICQ